MGLGGSSISQAFTPLPLLFSEGLKLKLIRGFRGVKILLERHLRISNIVSPKLSDHSEFWASENRRGRGGRFPWASESFSSAKAIHRCPFPSSLGKLKLKHAASSRGVQILFERHFRM